MLWRSVYAQTFFQNRQHQKYFAVNYTPPIDHNYRSSLSCVYTSSSHQPSPPSAQPIRVLTAEEQVDLNAMNTEWQALVVRHEEEMRVQDQEVLKQDKTGWWTLTGWPEHFRGRHLDYLAHASRVPDKDDTMLQEVVRICNVTLHHATAGLSSLHRELRRWLRSPKLEEVASRPLARLEDDNSQDQYYNYWRRFICYCVRVWISQQQLASTPFTSHQQTPHTSRRSGEEETRSELESDDSSTDGDGDSDSNSSSGSGEWQRVRVRPAPSKPHEWRQPSTPPNVRDPMLDTRELFMWSDSQKAAMQSFYEEIVVGGDPNDKGRNELLGGLLMKVYQAFIFHQWTGGEYESGLVHYCAVLGIDADAHRLRRASDYSYMMAGMVWCVRVLASAILMPPTEREVQRTDPRWREQFMEGRRLFLTDGSGTPMSVMLSWLAYGKYITMNSGNEGAVAWSADR